DLRVLYTQDSSVFTFYLFDADAASTDMYTLSLHDALPISDGDPAGGVAEDALDGESLEFVVVGGAGAVSVDVVHLVGGDAGGAEDRKSTRLNSSHVKISYAVFCLKKKKVEQYRKLE